MEELRRELSEALLLESLNAQHIDRLAGDVAALRDSISSSIAQLATSLATQAQALNGFRELYAREIAFIHQALNDVKDVLKDLQRSTSQEKDMITAVEKDIAVTRGSIRGAVMSWSGFIALIALITDKAIEIFARK